MNYYYECICNHGLTIYQKRKPICLDSYQNSIKLFVETKVETEQNICLNYMYTPPPIYLSRKFKTTPLKIGKGQELWNFNTTFNNVRRKSTTCHKSASLTIKMENNLYIFMTNVKFFYFGEFCHTNFLFKWMYSQSMQSINNNLTLVNYIKLLVIYIAYS